MRSSESPSKRKRGLVQLSNSSPAASDSNKTIFKRRRLNSYPSKTAPNTIQALKKVLGGVFGYGSNGDNNEVTQTSSEHDEIDDNASQSSTGNQAAPSMDDAHDESRAAMNGHSSTELSEDVARELERASSTEGAIAESGHNHHENPSNNQNKDSTRPLNGPGSRLALNALREGSVASTADSSMMEETPSGNAARSSGRERKRPRRFSNEMAEASRQETKSILTPASGGSKRGKKNVAFQVGEVGGLDLGFRDLPASGSKSSTSKKLDSRKATPWKQSSTIEENVSTEINGTPIPARSKSAIAKSKSALNTPRESDTIAVEDEEQLEEDEDEEDADVFCAVCAGGDSEEPNEILMCDNCDLAVHQQCYDIPRIPEGDWFCRDCRPDDGIVAMDIETVAEPVIELDALIKSGPDIDGIDYHLQIMQRLLLEKLTGRRRMKLHGLAEEYTKVHKVVEQTILAGEGNSMLVIGSRGCGKTTLVEAVLDELSEEHRHNFHIVKLNGFIHTDDKLALRDIWRQLGREMDVEDELTAKTSSFADTLASLLALLSHPTEISDVDDGSTAKSVIFVLDEFDLFTTHPRQTLLYNLFDIAQSRKAPIAILGLTTRVDVVESLEKRVKSRFSHRYVHLPLPKSLSVYWDICRAGLSVDLNEIVEQGFDPGLAGQDEFLEYWNSMLETLFTQDNLFMQHLQSHYYRSKSVSSFLTTCILPVANLVPSSLPLTGRSFASSTSLSPPDSKLHLLQSLAELDLAMLIAAARLDVILDTDTCNFAMAYDEYSNLTTKHKIQASSAGLLALGTSAKIWGREVAMGSWEKLISCELLIPAGLGGGGLAAREAGREGKMWRVDIGIEEIPGSVDGLSSVLAKWCKEI